MEITHDMTNHVLVIRNLHAAEARALRLARALVWRDPFRWQDDTHDWRCAYCGAIQRLPRPRQHAPACVCVEASTLLEEQP
jgi:hypothetical protein